VAEQKPDLPQGTLDLLILKALSSGPTHGYGAGQRIQQLAEDMLTGEERTLYPASRVSGALRRTTGGRGSTG